VNRWVGPLGLVSRSKKKGRVAGRSLAIALRARLKKKESITRVMTERGDGEVRSRSGGDCARSSGGGVSDDDAGRGCGVARSDGRHTGSSGPAATSRTAGEMMTARSRRRERMEAAKVRETLALVLLV
jgi:hypothetical protein